MVVYEANQLVVSIPTETPELLHQALVNSLIDGLKARSQFKCESPQPDHSSYWLLDLLEHMQPVA